MSNLLNGTRVSCTVGGKEIIMETGRLARQASGAIWIQCEGTVALVTVCEAVLDTPKDFFPLTVEYSEKMYAAGRIPGNFFRREVGKPSDNETLNSRLIDRPIRPLFPKGYGNEIQVLASVISADQKNMPDTLCITAASAAIMISSIPFEEPIAGARLGRVNGEFVLNPTVQQLEESEMDFVFAASKDAIVMVEGEAEFLPESVILEALEWGHKEIQPLIKLQEELVALVGKEKTPYVPVEKDPALLEYVEKIALESGIADALRVPEKMERKEALKTVKKAIKEKIAADPEMAENEEVGKCVGEVIDSLIKKLVRSRIQKEGTRIDTRDTKTVRPIEIETSVLPMVHGSVLFARGETKSLVTTTLGSTADEMRFDGLNGDQFKSFMLHYNFPAYSVGEVKPVRVGRREVGHGHLAERALKPVLPAKESFPYTIRIVSDTLESNGSSSMAAVCGGCLSLMDAGVPIKAPVAGVAMGLIKEGEDFIVLTDILGDEDALGDMDFKIAGTAEGVTAVQMDIKIAGLSSEIMSKAMDQAKQARLHILGEMAKALPTYRENLSENAPQFETIEVNPDVIRLIIGPGGKNIKAITLATGASVDIDDSGKINIFAPNAESLAQAKEMVSYYDQRAELGKNYTAKVKKVMEIGAIVEILPNLEALVHVSQLDTARVEKTEGFVAIGQEMEVKVIEINGDKVRASRKAVLLEEQGIEWTPESTARPPRREGGRDGGNRRDGGRRDGGRNDRNDRNDRGDRNDRRPYRDNNRD